MEYDYIDIESAWRETGIPCEKCGGMTYSDGKSRPQCGDDGCLELVSDERIWTWLITYTLSELDEWERAGARPDLTPALQKERKMSIEETIRKMLVDRGMFESQCDQVIARMKASENNEAMSGRWQDSPEGYPPMIMTLAWFSARAEAIKFIDETCPLAWFRGMFDTNPQPLDTGGETGV